jgi:hypothetical protein
MCHHKCLHCLSFCSLNQIPSLCMHSFSLICQPHSIFSNFNQLGKFLGKVYLRTKKLLCPSQSLQIHKSSSMFLVSVGLFPTWPFAFLAFYLCNFSIRCIYICLSVFLNSGACGTYLSVFPTFFFILPCSSFCLSCGQLLLLSLLRELFLNRYSLLHTFAPGGHSQRYPPYWLIQRAPWPQGLDWHSFRSTH